jgi:CBS-domain-containing membrane protein
MENSKSTKSKKTPAQKVRFTQRELNQAIKELSKEVNRKITTRLLKEMIAGK